MSLLLGFGRGLQQGAGMLSQGMAEDRAVKRAEELERMRDASMEKRWLRETEMRQRERSEDRELRASERAEDATFRQSESNRQAGQFDRQMSVREKQVIESNLGSIMAQRRKEEQAIVERYQKLGEMGGVTEAMQKQMASEIESVRGYYDKELGNMVSSYGDSIKGTGFEYLLDFKPQSDKPRSGDAIPTTATQGQRDLSGYVSSIMKSGQENRATVNSEVSPWLTGFSAGRKGMYGPDAAQQPDTSNFSILDKGFYTGGKHAGLLFGGLQGDAMQYVGDTLQPITQKLTETPVERRQRLAQNNSR